MIVRLLDTLNTIIQTCKSRKEDGKMSSYQWMDGDLTPQELFIKTMCANMIANIKGPTCDECWVSVPDESQCAGCKYDKTPAKQSGFIDPITYFNRHNIVNNHSYKNKPFNKGKYK